MLPLRCLYADQMLPLVAAIRSTTLLSRVTSMISCSVPMSVLPLGSLWQLIADEPQSCDQRTLPSRLRSVTRLALYSATSTRAPGRMQASIGPPSAESISQMTLPSLPVSEIRPMPSRPALSCSQMSVMPLLVLSRSSLVKLMPSPFAFHQPSHTSRAFLRLSSSALPMMALGGFSPARRKRSEERRVGKEGRSRWAPYP